MRQYLLTISSKNKKSIESFLNFFFNNVQNYFYVIKKLKKRKKEIKTLTILKSPHVNKKAQEQFEFRLFTKQILISTTYFNKQVIFLKNVINNLFHDVSVKFKLLTNIKTVKKSQLLNFHPNNFKLYKKKKKLNNFRQKTKQMLNNYRFTNQQLTKKETYNLTNFLKVLNIFGKTSIDIYNNKPSLNSSAVEQRTENPCVDSSNLSLDNIVNLYEKFFMEHVCQHKKWAAK